MQTRSPCADDDGVRGSGGRSLLLQLFALMALYIVLAMSVQVAAVYAITPHWNRSRLGRMSVSVVANSVAATGLVVAGPFGSVQGVGIALGGAVLAFLLFSWAAHAESRRSEGNRVPRSS
jgi:hypothetical protein